MKRVLVAVGVVVVLAAGGVTTAALLSGDPAPASPHRRAAATTTSLALPTTSTAPPLTAAPTSPSGIVQPVEARLPAPPPEGIDIDAEGPAVLAYQQRLTDLRFDPGPVDGRYGQATAYAVEGLQKLRGLPVTGVIGPAEVDALEHFTYPEPLQPDGEPNRTEVDVAKQVLILYEEGQPKLLTTTSTGSGEQYCYDTPLIDPTEHICEIANTPSGRYQYYLYRSGWDIGVNGGMYNPLYFNKGIAVHGLQSVPSYPASHGCVRIPMHLAEYFHTLVHQGDPVYVLGGTPAKIVSVESLVPAEPTTTAPPATAPPTTSGGATTTTTSPTTTTTAP